YTKTGGYWTGINAATMALILGRESVAAGLAQQVRTQCLQALKDVSGGDRYWPLATLGEAGLILRQWSEAEMWYAQAAQLGKGRYGDLSSTRRNLRLLVEHLDIDGSSYEQSFQIPKILVFTGHMIDHPNRSVPRFPSHLEPAVQRAIEQRLEKLGANVGYASAACGGDIIFHEALLKRRGEIHIVLPFEQESFVKESIDFLSDRNWVQRFADLSHKAAEVVLASEGRFRGGGGISFEYANQILSGLACIRADQLETDAVLVALWDGKSGDGPGGTASMIKNWQALGKQTEIIDLAEILHSVSPDLARRESDFAEPSSPATVSEVEGTSIRSLLFADLVNFTDLGEAEIPTFVEHFLGGVARLIKTGSYSPEARNTWGDGLYFAFRDTREAGLFALDLRDFVRKTDWVAKGLPKALSIRIGLHVGPVHGFVDPITEKYTYFGGHVARTARIEPITPPGKVYASQAFAGLATASGVDGFKCEYVGQTPLAKGFGVFPAYHVRRT
ncbi:MAG TPA: adenylate/guanylate cyclase domain-containing protein, partial [Acidobacteriota bacterium]|nr:adenylate/guanylate cyclase domain-containing protein [Acidobacteriota bacterium]